MLNGMRECECVSWWGFLEIYPSQTRKPHCFFSTFSKSLKYRTVRILVYQKNKTKQDPKKWKKETQNTKTTSVSSALWNMVHVGTKWTSTETWLRLQVQTWILKLWTGLSKFSGFSIFHSSLIICMMAQLRIIQNTDLAILVTHSLKSSEIMRAWSSLKKNSTNCELYDKIAHMLFLSG